MLQMNRKCAGLICGRLDNYGLGLGFSLGFTAQLKCDNIKWWCAGSL